MEEAMEGYECRIAELFLGSEQSESWIVNGGCEAVISEEQVQG